MFEITELKARQILDSRGLPTIEVDVVLGSGVVGRASVPSGASTGRLEAVEWRDGDATSYMGKSVYGAVHHVYHEVAAELIGVDCREQNLIDQLLVDLDHSPSKSRLGANTLLAVSLAVARAAAEVTGLPLARYIGGAQSMMLPVPLMNILNGGAHADNGLPFQELMIVPTVGESFQEALHVGVLTFQALKALLKEKGLSTMVGDEGGFAPRLESIEHGLMLLVDAIRIAGFEPARDIWIALDCASSQFYLDEHYVVGSHTFSSDQFSSYLKRLCEEFPIISIEDGMAEDDWAGWTTLTNILGESVQLVGDDLFVTQSEFLAKGISTGVANAILLKPNQVGTLTETIETFSLARQAQYGTIVSHRSGETEDSFIADLAVGLSAGQIKTGAPCRSDRIAKYNQLLRIEEQLGASVSFAGLTPFLKLKRSWT